MSASDTADGDIRTRRGYSKWLDRMASFSMGRAWSYWNAWFMNQKIGNWKVRRSGSIFVQLGGGGGGG